MLTFLSVGVFVFYYIGLINMLYACPTHINLKVYLPRKPQDSAYCRCVEDCFEKDLETFGSMGCKAQAAARC